MKSYILGLDIGSKSIGWALVDKKKTSLVNVGVRVFPEGVERDKGFEKSKNQARREARSSRRQKWRKRMRKEKLVKILRNSRLLSETDEELEKEFIKDPYQLRSNAIQGKIELFELGRIFYHINQRRGFKSNRKSGKAAEDGVVKKEAGALQSEIEKAGCRTLGQYLAQLDPEKQRRRERYTFRSMYEEEFDAIWEKQKEYYPAVLTDDLKPKIKEETIFFQRPLKPSDHLIGKCELEPDQPRCPRGDFYARRFNIFQDLNNLFIIHPDGTETNLTSEQREKLLIELGKAKEVKWEKAKKILGLLETQKFNLEKGKTASLKGDEFNGTMAKVLGAARWDSMTIEQKAELNTAVLEMEDDEVIPYLKNEYKLEDKDIEKILKISFPKGYMSYSRKAIQKLLPYMEEGAKTYQAREKAGYIRDDQDPESQKEFLELGDIPENITNPLVKKALFEVRKVVNAIIQEYGKPETIKLEMARDVKGTKKEREELRWKMLEQEKENSKVRERLQNDCGITKPSRDDIIKYKLWEECGKICPYTGRSISQNSLFGSNPEFQIEHILPYDRSLDDSYMNKTLCYVEENRKKGKQTPFEFYQNKPEIFEQIKQRIACLPYPKRRKFVQENIELDEAIKRELNDSRYICREVVGFLGNLGVTVMGTRGKVTAELRHMWGLNSVLDLSGGNNKNRDDHRHHAIDAVVTALTNPKHLRNLAETKYASQRLNFAPPWETFRDDTAEKINQIIVSHKATKRIRGKLHEDTNYGLTGRKDEKGQDIYVYRKKLEDLTIAMIDRIVDPVIRNMIKRRLEKHGIKTDGKGSIPKEVWKEPLHMPCKSGKEIPIKRVRLENVSNNMILLNDKQGKPYRGVEPGNNHHIEIFEFTDRKGNVKREGMVISLFEAIRRKKNGEPVIRKDYGDGKKFVCSLACNEMFMLELDNENKLVPHRVQKLIQDGRIILRPHTYAGKVSESDQPPLIQRKSPNTIKGYKIHVDYLGRIQPAND
jgi:CRISPR-associated endonuclease Csn1